MKFGWLLLVFVAGLLIPAQAAMNAKMREYVLNPMYSTLLNFGIGAIGIIIVAYITIVMGQASNLRGSFKAPWWAWCGGFIGALFVTTSVLAISRTGAATFSVLIIAGQILGALVMDHFGWLELPQFPLTPQRIVGALLLMVGVWLIQRY